MGELVASVLLSADQVQMGHVCPVFHRAGTRAMVMAIRIPRCLVLGTVIAALMACAAMRMELVASVPLSADQVQMGHVCQVFHRVGTHAMAMDLKLSENFVCSWRADK